MYDLPVPPNALLYKKPVTTGFYSRDDPTYANYRQEQAQASKSKKDVKYSL
jgi:hypothetical protein